MFMTGVSNLLTGSGNATVSTAQMVMQIARFRCFLDVMNQPSLQDSSSPNSLPFYGTSRTQRTSSSLPK